jgi:Tfp pilus assembly protein PilX
MSKLNYIRNEKGMALITVLMVFLVLVILLGATMFAAVTNQRNAIFANEHSEAYYVAESGINLRVAQMSDFLNDP